MKKITLLGIALLLSLTLLLGACAPKAPSAGEVPVDIETGEIIIEEGEESPISEATIKIAVLPIVDTLPLFVAEYEGLFEEYDLNVELIPVVSAPELSQMVAAGQVDGMITDGLTVAFFNKDDIQMKIVRYAQRPAENAPHFFILAAKDSGILSPADLKGVEIGVSEGTIIEYVTDRLLEKQGFTPEEIQTIAVPKISDRMALLASGELKAAVLPDPLASLAILQGATVVLDDSQTPEYGASVYVLRKSFVDENPEATGGFVRAIDIAISLLEEDPEEYRSLLADKELVPAPLLDSFVIPPFPSGNYTQTEWADTVLWAVNNNLLPVNLSYLESVENDLYIP